VLLRHSRPRGEGPDPKETIAVTVVVRSRAGADALAEALDALSKQLPHERTILTDEEHALQYGSTAEDLAAVQAFAVESGLQVVETSVARRTVELSGSLEAFSRAFGVHFQLYDSPRGSYRFHEGPVAVPQELQNVIEAVIGLDDKPVLRPEAASGEPEKLTHVDPRTIAAYYQFPSGATGAGQCIAVLGFGGGYYQSDLETYFRLRGIKMPEIRLVELLGQRNQPADRAMIVECAQCLGLLVSGATGPPNPAALAYLATIECTMDLEILGTLAPDALLVTYMAPGTALGQYTAFSKAAFDPVNACSVVNCSWGAPEDVSTPSFLTALDKLFQHAALKGVTICVSTGDMGDGSERYGKPTPQFPASSPNVLACGGSSVSADLSRETSWYEPISGTPIAMSGGYGLSQFFAMPAWQKDAGTGSTDRAYPDVVSKADVLDGYDVVVTGLDIPMGGTSAAAPMWAALAALINERLGRRVGLLGPCLYTKPFAQAVRDITQSGGGPCTPGPGWNPCTGLGSPVGTGLLAALSPDPPGPGSG
jgi:kumamolisin